MGCCVSRQKPSSGKKERRRKKKRTASLQQQSNDNTICDASHPSGDMQGTSDPKLDSLTGGHIAELSGSPKVKTGGGKRNSGSVGGGDEKGGGGSSHSSAHSQQNEQMPDATVHNPLIPQSGVITGSPRGPTSSAVLSTNTSSSPNPLRPPATTSTTTVPGRTTTVAGGGGGGGTDTRKMSTCSDQNRSNSLVPLANNSGGGAVSRADLMCSNKTANEDSDSHGNDPDGSFTIPLGDEDEIPMTAEMEAMIAALPEKNIDAIPIAVLTQQVLSGLYTIPTTLDFGTAFRTKMRFRDIDGWLAEVGSVPAAVVSISSFNEREKGSRLSAKQLEQNQRLLLQLKSRTTTSNQLRATISSPVQPAINVSPALNATGGGNTAAGGMAGGVVVPAGGVGGGPLGSFSLGHPLGTQNSSTSIDALKTSGGGPHQPGLVGSGSSSLAVPPPEDFNEDDTRRYSKASSKNRVPDRNAADQELGVSDFYQELEEEERRLSTIKNSSSDDDFG